MFFPASVILTTNCKNLPISRVYRCLSLLLMINDKIRSQCIEFMQKFPKKINNFVFQMYAVGKEHFFNLPR